MKTTRSPQADRRAVTLLEICIVVLILAILAVFLFPLVKGMAEKSKAVTCVQRLRALSAILHSVVSDNNGKLYLFRDGSIKGELRWYFQFKEYAKLSDAGAQQAFGCPSMKVNEVNDWSCYGLRAGGTPGKRESVVDEKERKAGLYVLPVAAVTEPGKFLMMADTATSSGLQTFRIIPPGLYSGTGIQIRHQDRANALFLDGHVEALGRRGLYDAGISEILDRERNPLSTKP